MAVSKKTKHQMGCGAPVDAAPFVKLIDEGLAEPGDVLGAWLHVVAQAGPQPLQTGDIVHERPEADPDSPSARLTWLYRMRVVLGGDAR